MHSGRSIVVIGAAALAACSPPLNWREVRPERSPALLLMPCRPQVQTRSVRLVDHDVRLSLSACSAGGQTWALAFGDLGDPSLVAPALGELRRSAGANIGATALQTLPLDVAGATPNAASGRFSAAGHLPDGADVLMQAAVFSRGTIVFQATVIGRELPAEAAQTFFTSFQLGS